MSVHSCLPVFLIVCRFLANHFISFRSFRLSPFVFVSADANKRPCVAGLSGSSSPQSPRVCEGLACSSLQARMQNYACRRKPVCMQKSPACALCACTHENAVACMRTACMQRRRGLWQTANSLETRKPQARLLRLHALFKVFVSPRISVVRHLHRV